MAARPSPLKSKLSGVAGSATRRRQAERTQGQLDQYRRLPIQHPQSVVARRKPHRQSLAPRPDPPADGQGRYVDLVNRSRARRQGVNLGLYGSASATTSDQAPRPPESASATRKRIEIHRRHRAAAPVGDKAIPRNPVAFFLPHPSAAADETRSARREISGLVTPLILLRHPKPRWKTACMLSWKRFQRCPEAGEMAEWLKAHAWKACLGETLTWVRIPLSPPF